MKSNMNLSIWVPFLFIVVMIVFLIQGFNAIDVVTIIGVVLIVVYYALGYYHRKDAFVINDEKMIVQTPIKKREYDMKNITEISVTNREGGVLKGLYNGELITLCGNIYEATIDEIKTYILLAFPHIKETPKERKEEDNGRE